MLILQSFPAARGEPSMSPFCVKAMCLLRMAGLEWRADFEADVRKAPKAKFPVLIDGAETIADSAAIRAHLEAKAGVDFDAGLDARDLALSHALVRMAEEHLYFIVLHESWAPDDAWAATRASAFGRLPPVLRSVVPPMVRRIVKRDLRGQGTGRFSDDERAERGGRDLAAIRAALGEGPFLFGDAPTAADASVGPMLGSLRGGAVSTKLREMVAQDDALTAYLYRVRVALYPPEAA